MGEPRLLSADEKRELILAHAAARGPEPHPFGLGSYIGIIACCLFVVGGWWFTVGAHFRRTISLRKDPAAQLVTQEVQRLRTGLGQESGGRSPTKGLSERLEDVRREYQQAVLQERVMEAAAAKIYLMSSSTTTIK